MVSLTELLVSPPPLVLIGLELHLQALVADLNTFM